MMWVVRIYLDIISIIIACKVCSLKLQISGQVFFIRSCSRKGNPIKLKDCPKMSLCENKDTNK